MEAKSETEIMEKPKGRQIFVFMENIVLYFVLGIFFGLIDVALAIIYLIIVYPAVGYLEYKLIKAKGSKFPKCFGWSKLQNNPNFTLKTFYKSTMRSISAFLLGVGIILIVRGIIYG